MRRIRLVLAIMLTVGVVSAQADEMLIWDNFEPADGYSTENYWTSVSSLGEPDAWLADDAIFDQPVEVSRIDWYGARQVTIAGTRIEYTAEVLIAEGEVDQQGIVDITEVFRVGELEYDSVDLESDSQLGTIYRGSVNFEPVALSPGVHYYYAVRLVTPGIGNNVILGTGVEQTHEGQFLTEAIAYSPLAFAGLEEWFTMGFISDPQGGGWTDVAVTDYSYQLYGVPEPAAGLLLLAGVFLVRRR